MGLKLAVRFGSAESLKTNARIDTKYAGEQHIDLGYSLLENRFTDADSRGDKEEELTKLTPQRWRSGLTLLTRGNEFPDYIADSDEEVAHMDDAFIQSLGGKLTLEAIDQMALRVFEWGAMTSEFETVWDEYPHQSKDVAAPKCELEDIAHSPAMLFSISCRSHCG
ncbi:unnamed protein product [Phytophthora fragariaefolia]|uniref:Unnamed protein product n=1 Tax=Phytophthora fragariaefolia TaxID=1490495 RepID=A0A9W6U705_9STRA|nr:unnamed protein product [Phytophthora fragariaefolia]